MVLDQENQSLIKEQDDIDKVYLYAKDFSEPKYEFFDQKREDAETKCIYWVFKYHGWCLWEYWWLQLKKEKKNLNRIWWHDCRHYDK